MFIYGKVGWVKSGILNLSYPTSESNALRAVFPKLEPLFIYYSGYAMELKLLTFKNFMIFGLQLFPPELLLFLSNEFKKGFARNPTNEFIEIPCPLFRPPELFFLIGSIFGYPVRLSYKPDITPLGFYDKLANGIYDELPV